MNRMIRVACGLSGGVDSSVAAMLLKNQGYDVLGVFMRIWKASGDEGLKGECPSSGDFEDAAIVARKLNIRLVEVDFEKEYWNLVFSEFLKDYEEGRTPNPDILCNQFIKFGAFFKYCTERLGADVVATGHYGRTDFGCQLNTTRTPDYKAKLLTAVDRTKDQTFFLSRIPQQALKRTWFPLGDVRKTQVRRMAKDSGLDKVAVKPDSTGICFIGPRKFNQFVDQYLEPKVGDFVDIDSGLVVGHHTGIHHWTLGQRCHMGGFPQAYYVAHKHVPTQTIYVAGGHENPALYSSGAVTEEATWISEEEPQLLKKNGQLDCHFKYQQTEEAVPCRLSRTDTNNELRVTFTNGMLRALTPGQYGVLYLGEECLGSARIRRVTTGHSVLNQLHDENLPMRNDSRFSSC